MWFWLWLNNGPKLLFCSKVTKSSSKVIKNIFNNPFLKKSKLGNKLLLSSHENKKIILTLVEIGYEYC